MSKKEQIKKWKEYEEYKKWKKKEKCKQKEKESCKKKKEKDCHKKKHYCHGYSCGSGSFGAAVGQNAALSSDIEQLSQELIVIKDSCDISVTTNETQIAASLQAAIQVAIAIVINITIADAARAERVTQELLEKSRILQANRQQLIIKNSKNISVTTNDTDVAISLQLLLQILFALVVQLGIL